MKFLTEQDVLVIHAKIVDETGGSHGVRDIGLLSSAVARPLASFGGVHMYRTVFEKTAALFDSLSKNHAFIDGNKRTAYVASARMLFVNGYDLHARNDVIVRFTLKVIEQRLGVDDIAAWLQNHSK